MQKLFTFSTVLSTGLFFFVAIPFSRYSHLFPIPGLKFFRGADSKSVYITQFSTSFSQEDGAKIANAGCICTACRKDFFDTLCAVLLNVQEVLTPCTHSPLLSRQTLVMTIGLSKQQQIFCKCPKNAVIASQCAHWRGNPFPFTRVVFTETLRKSQRLGCGLPRRFAPRNDSAGRNPVIKIHMLIKADSYNSCL